MRLAVYLLLMEDDLRKSTAHGLIRYNNGSIRIENTKELRDELLGVVQEMKEALFDDDVGRSHDEVRSCGACSMARACEERLV
jgi:CRISPR/Cas system-associated exonuclease Cas4 (RecB family)